MKCTIIQENNPILAWKKCLQIHMNQNPLFVETDLNLIDLESDLFKRYYKEYKWHFKDSRRSLLQNMERNLTRYEFSYYDRIHSYFGKDQVKAIVEKPNEIISLWDPKNDSQNSPKPCLVTIKIIPEDKFLHLSVTFRSRDIIRRMYPNFIALKIFQNDCAEMMKKHPGKLFDYSNQAFYREEDLNKVLSWIEFE